MICNIILRIPSKRPEIIYTTSNFNEAINEFEMIALDEVEKLGGTVSRVIIKDINKITLRGYYCISDSNKLSIYRKEKNGWFIGGQLKLLKEFELLYYKKIREIDKDNYTYDSMEMKSKFLELIENKEISLNKIPNYPIDWPQSNSYKNK